MKLLKNKKDNNFKALLWIFKRTKKHIPLVAIISLFSGIVSLSGIVLAYLTKIVLDIATKDASGSFFKWAVAILGVVLLELILSSADTVLKAYASGKLTISIRKHLFKSLVQKKYVEISKYHSGEVLNRFTSDADIVISSVLSLIPHIIVVFTKLIAGMATLFLLDKKIAVIVLVLGLIIPTIGRFISLKYKRMHKDCQKTEGQIRSFMQECVENIVVLKSFQSIEPFSKKLAQYMNKNFKIKIKRSLLTSSAHFTLNSFFTFSYYLVLLWGASRISDSAMTYGTLMAFLQLVQQLRGPLQTVSGILPQYYQAIASAERLMELGVGDNDKSAETEENLQVIKSTFSGIEFKDITFAYKDENILENCSFSVPAGKITALTGESGSGKSTIFKLILGLYEAQAGEIIVNEIIPLDTSLRGLFAYVPQGNLVLSGTVRENISLCNDNISDEDIIKAMKAAEIYDIIAELPDGLDTVLKERGVGLSEGQIQRISIARALLTDATVLLLDEATSALDEQTETKVLNNIKAMSDKTVLFVTHRNTSLKVCDRIVHAENKKFSVIKE
ncbi:MAG: ABC transporter ATP-binding protein [Clostridia bacterium]|nr:ABC transporter ATP-binding protein [Clostridia bacterium]